MNIDDEIRLRKWLDVGGADGPYKYGFSTTAVSAETECEAAVRAASRNVSGRTVNVLSFFPLLLAYVRELEQPK